jgi:adenylate cyclase
MGGMRKIAAILVADIVGYSRLAGADEDRTLSRLRGLRSDLIDPAIDANHGRIVKRTGDGSLIEFRSVVDAVRCAIEVQTGLIERNAGLPPERRIEFRVGIHLGDVAEENDGDLMGDGVNIAARLEGICEPGAICLSEDAYRQVKQRLDLKVTDLGATQLKNIAEPVRVYSLEVGRPAPAKTAPAPAPEIFGPPLLSIVVLPCANIGGDPEQEHFVDGVTESLTTDLSRIRGAVVIAGNTAFAYRGKPLDVRTIGRGLNVRYVLAGANPIRRCAGASRRTTNNATFRVLKEFYAAGGADLRRLPLHLRRGRRPLAGNGHRLFDHRRPEPFGRSILVSPEFAAAAMDGDRRLEPLGRNALRGVREPKEIFALDLDRGQSSPSPA